jgi:hypothetical protein
VVDDVQKVFIVDDSGKDTLIIPWVKKTELAHHPSICNASSYPTE